MSWDQAFVCLDADPVMQNGTKITALKPNCCSLAYAGERPHDGASQQIKLLALERSYFNRT